MGEGNSINLKDVILHILDQDAQMPILSKETHPLDNGEIVDFFQGHIIKVLKDNSLKKAYFNEEESFMRDLCDKLLEGMENFKEVSCLIAENLYSIMQKHQEIPSADLACLVFDIDGKAHLGIFKFNYRSSYIHFVETIGGEPLNKVVKQRTTLPGDGQKVDECIIIKLEDYSISILEKKYEIDGEKQNYLSTKFLNCLTDISDKEKVKFFKRANEVFKKTYFDTDATKLGDIKNAVMESIEENGVIDVVEVAENAFRSNPEMKNIYIDHIQGSGFKEKTIEIDPEFGEKAFKKQRIKTDTGIEINLPIDFYKNKDKVEFINNPDGTISIVIKNITKIIDK